MTDTAEHKIKPVPEHLTDHVAFQHHRKDDLVQNTTIEENDDLLPAVEIWREGKCIAVVLPDQIDKHKALDAAYVGMTGFGGDELYLTLDSHYSQSTTNPLTGEDWKQGEMQQACDNENACALGLITDTLWMIHKTRAGVEEYVNMPYHVHKTARSVRWQPDDYISTGEEGFGMQGLIPDALEEIFAAPTMAEKQAEHPEYMEIAEGLDAEVRQAHEDMAVLRVLAARGHQVVLYSHNETHEAIVKESTARMTAEARARNLLDHLMKGENVADLAAEARRMAGETGKV